MVLGTPAELQAHAALMQKFPEMEHASPNMAHVKPGADGQIVWQFTQPGEFRFACLQPGHFEAGMLGRLADPKMLDTLREGDKLRFRAERVDGAITVTAIEAAK